jgi:kynureninase
VTCPLPINQSVDLEKLRDRALRLTHALTTLGTKLSFAEALFHQCLRRQAQRVGEQ